MHTETHVRLYTDCYFCPIFAEIRVCRKVCKVLWNSVELKLLHAVRNGLVTVITRVFASFSSQMCQVILKLLSWHISWPFVCGKFLSCKTGTVHKWLNINCLWQHTAEVLHMACILWNNLSKRKWNVRSLLDHDAQFLMDNNITAGTNTVKWSRKIDDECHVFKLILKNETWESVY